MHPDRISMHAIAWVLPILSVTDDLAERAEGCLEKVSHGYLPRGERDVLSGRVRGSEVRKAQSRITAFNT